MQHQTCRPFRYPSFSQAGVNELVVCDFRFYLLLRVLILSRALEKFFPPNIPRILRSSIITLQRGNECRPLNQLTVKCKLRSGAPLTLSPSQLPPFALGSFFALHTPPPLTHHHHHPQYLQLQSLTLVQKLLAAFTMPKKGAGSKEAAAAALAAPSVRSVQIEIPVPSVPRYVPGSGPKSGPITLAPVKDSTAYILEKYVLPKLSETRPQDRRLYYYLVGFTDIPQARILVPCHKALDYVDPFEMERWEFKNDEKMDEEKKRLAQEATTGKLPAKKRGRPAKVRVGPGALEPDISKPSPHGTSVVPSVVSLGDNQHEPTLVLDSQLTGPSLSTPQKRNRPSLDQVGDSQPTPSLHQPTGDNQFGDEEIRRQLFWESTKRRLSSDYSANNDADQESISQQLIMDSSASRPVSSNASSSGGYPVLNASGPTRVTRSASKRPVSAVSTQSGFGSGSGTGSQGMSTSTHPHRIMSLSNHPLSVAPTQAGQSGSGPGPSSRVPGMSPSTIILPCHGLTVVLL